MCVCVSNTDTGFISYLFVTVLNMMESDGHNGDLCVCVSLMNSDSDWNSASS